MKKLKIIQLFLLMVLLITSCGTVKNAYFKDIIPNELYPIQEKSEFVVQRNDRLSIVVMCKEPELAKVFNVGYIVSNVSTDGEGALNKQLSKGYRVDANGEIEFPLLGKIFVVGLTLPQVSEVIKNKIIKEEYIKDPIVVTEILNFKYTVLGALAPGVYTAEDGEITLLDAIAKCGDIQTIGKLDRIAVIREIDGSRQIFYHDIRSKDIFDSPCYYLQQNDIIYVEPKYRGQTKGERAMSLTLTLLTFFTTIGTYLYLFKK
jgi:Periplasmic protein involved in polysaccharide export